MRRVVTGIQQCSVFVALFALTATLANAGEFTVNGRNEYKDLRCQLQAANFLARATFAYSQADVDLLASRIRAIGHRRALGEWIDNQIAVAPSFHEGSDTPTPGPRTVLKLLQDDGYADPYADRPEGAANRLDYIDYAWWQNALDAPDQLRQRVAFALMQLVVINRDPNVFRDDRPDAAGLPRYTGIVHYYDRLIANAFGNYRTVLGEVTYHPVMGVFLTHINNVKPSADGLLLPDENYAREILQLFSMGEHRMDIQGVLLRDRGGNLIQNYTNDDIKALARVFTGLQYAEGNGQTGVNLHDPMEIRNFNNHDFNEKVFPNLRITLPATSPSVAAANAEINEAVDLIYSHPNVGPFIAVRMIQRLVKANPSKRYIRDVAQVFNDNGNGVRGDLGAVIKKILLHNEALRSQRYVRIRSANRQIVGLRVTTRGTEHSKLVEPMVRYTQFIKVFGGQPVDAQDGFRIRPDSRDLSQLPYRAPSVFNYFRPEYLPPGYQNYKTSRRIPNGRLYSPEAQIYTPVFANRYQTLLYRHLHNNVGSYNSLNFSNSFTAETAMAATGLGENPKNISELLEHLDLYVCHGSLSEASKTAIEAAVTQGHTDGNTNINELARIAIFGVMGAPEAAIDE